MARAHPVDDHDHPRGPDYRGGSLVNLMGEIEHRLTGAAPSPGLSAELAAIVPDATTYVVLLMDGLGAHQLEHEAAAGLAAANAATLDAPFPTTTTVSLASVATGRPPIEHGLLGHLIWLPEHGTVVNSLKWIAKGGAPLDIDTQPFLPSPNLWERCRQAGIEAITVQPGNFEGTPLTRALYRGCRFEPVWDNGDLADAVVQLAATERRLIFGYLPEVDFAAHVFGQRSTEYADALRSVQSVWEHIAARLPHSVVMVGTADHGHLDYAAADKVLIDRATSGGLNLFGDPRALYASGPEEELTRFAEHVPARWAGRDELLRWWGAAEGAAIDPDIEARMPDGVFLAEPGRLLIPGHMDRRLVGYHGGLSTEEMTIPLLVAGAGEYSTTQAG